MNTKTICRTYSFIDYVCQKILLNSQSLTFYDTFSPIQTVLVAFLKCGKKACICLSFLETILRVKKKLNTYKIYGYFSYQLCTYLATKVHNANTSFKGTILQYCKSTGVKDEILMNNIDTLYM